MRTLVEKWHDLLEIYETTDDAVEAERLFVEQLTFSEPGEILALIKEDYENTHLSLPPWIRNLAFRLACLLAPNDAQLRRQAAIALRLYGPDYARQADDLDEEAAALESH